MNVLGIDPSLTGTGAALYTPAAFQTLTVSTKGIPQAAHLGDALRIRNVLMQLRNWARGVELDLVVMEGPAFSRHVGKTHERGGLWWHLYGHYAVREQLPVLVVGPTLRSKYATGSGVASKTAVMVQAIKRYPTVDIRNDNEADAVVLAAMGLHVAGQPLADVPKTHMEALKTLAMPPVLGG